MKEFNWADHNRLKRCDKCKYRTPVTCEFMGCDYMGILHERRPCPPGDKCTVFEEGKMLSKQQRIILQD